MAHRLGALVVVAITIPLCLFAARRRDPKTRAIALAVAVLVVLEFAVGVAAVLSQLPIALTVMHNWATSLLLLGLIGLSTRLLQADIPESDKQIRFPASAEAELQQPRH